MLKRTLILLSLMATMVFVVQPLHSVQGIVLTDAERVMSTAAEPSAVENSNKQAGGDNSFLRALKAPFKAIGRLFGRKKDPNKLQRISEKDIEKFMGSPANQIKTTTAAEANAMENATGNSDATAAAHLEKGRAFLHAGRLNEAIEELSLADSLDHGLAEVSTLLGVAYEGKGLHDLALKSFEAAVAAEKNNPQNLNNLGYVLYKNGEYEAATKYLKRAAKLAPDDPRIWNNLGLAQSERGKFNDAYKSFAHALGEYKGRLNIATRLEAQGSNEEAIKHLEKALALRANSPDLTRLQKLYELTGQREKAENARKALITLDTLANAPAPE